MQTFGKVVELIGRFLLKGIGDVYKTTLLIISSLARILPKAKASKGKRDVLKNPAKPLQSR